MTTNTSTLILTTPLKGSNPQVSTGLTEVHQHQHVLFCVEEDLPAHTEVPFTISLVDPRGLVVTFLFHHATDLGDDSRSLTYYSTTEPHLVFRVLRFSKPADLSL